MAQTVPAPTATAIPPYPEALPPTTNPILLEKGSLSLYTSILFLASAAVLQHFIIFGIFALLRGFSFRGLLDLHYITFLFALTVAAAPGVFLLDLRLDQMKLLFFLEHEAIEYLIFVRVLAPSRLVRNWSGMILFIAWTVLFLFTTVVVTDQFHHGAAMLSAWGAFTSDFAVGVAGAVLVRRWMMSTSDSSFGKRRIRAEGLAGLGFMMHGRCLFFHAERMSPTLTEKFAGFPTMCVPPIFTCVLYEKMHPHWFAYAWVIVWISGYFAVALCVPATALFFWNISFCCGSRRKVFPGQVGWEDYMEEEQSRSTFDRFPAHRTVGVRMSYKEPLLDQLITRKEMVQDGG